MRHLVPARLFSFFFLVPRRDDMTSRCPFCLLFSRLDERNKRDSWSLSWNNLRCSPSFSLFRPTKRPATRFHGAHPRGLIFSAHQIGNGQNSNEYFLSINTPSESSVYIESIKRRQASWTPACRAREWNRPQGRRKLSTARFTMIRLA